MLFEYFLNKQTSKQSIKKHSITKTMSCVSPVSSSRVFSPSARKNGSTNSVHEQLEFAKLKYESVLRTYYSTPPHKITTKLQEDVWAWRTFSQQVLPMLTFIDDE